MSSSRKPLAPPEAAAAAALLREAPYAYVGMTEAQGPYVLPLNFVFVGSLPVQGSLAEGDPALGAAAGAAPLGGTIYFHTGEGRKTAALDADPRVCLAITGGVAFIQGDSPCADAFSYRSLLVWGRARRVEDPTDREAALRAIVAKYDPSAADTPFGDRQFARTLLYRVSIETVSYKQEP